jgi:hypothetical protein
MRLAEGLPVVLHVPEQSGVALMRLDVVNDCGWGYSPFPLAHDTDGMLPKVGGSGFLPAGVVPTFSGRASALVVFPVAGFVV